MSEPDDHLRNLPDVLRNSDRPIIIYQGAPERVLDASTSSAAGVISWLALLTLCLGVIFFSLWTVWNPGRDARAYSPIYADGRPIGLAGQIAERREINERVEGIFAYVDQLRAEGVDGPATTLTHPIINDRDGIDLLRRRWDAMCNTIRARVYDRRIGLIDTRVSELRRMRYRADAAGRARLDEDIRNLQTQRAAQLDLRRTDGDPTLRCTPAAEAPACSDSSDAPWCDPAAKNPQDFVDEAP